MLVFLSSKLIVPIMKATIAKACFILAILMSVFVTCSKNDDPTETSDPQEGTIEAPPASTSSDPPVILREADAVVDDFLAKNDTMESLIHLADWFTSCPHITSARVCDDSLSVSMVFSSGLLGNYALNSLFGSIASGISIPSDFKISIMEGGDAKIVKVFDGNSRPDQQAVAETIDNISQSLEELGYSVTTESPATETMDISYFRRLFSNAPPILVLFTHGVNHSSGTDTRYGLATLEDVPDGTELDESEMNTYGIIRLRSIDRTVWTLLHEFASQNFNATEKCYFSLHACNVAQDNELIQGFMNQPDEIVLLAHSRAARFDQIRTLTQHMYNSLTDTFTIQQAYDDLPNAYHTRLFSEPDADIMLAETFLSTSYGPSREHSMAFYEESETGTESGVRIPSYTITSNVCSSGRMGCDSVIAIVVPRAPGTHQIADGVVIALFEGGAQFGAGPGLRGVSGTVTINAPQDGIISGGYTATVGRWGAGLIPSEHNPSETRSLTGYFKID